MDVAQIAQELLNEMNNNGTIRSIIHKQLEETITSVTRDLMRDYSDFGKKLRNRISESLDINLGDLDLQSYNAILSTVVADTLKGTAYASCIESVQTRIKQVVGQLEKEEWRLSELVEQYKTTLDSHDCPTGEIQIIVDEPSYGSIWVQIQPKKESEYGSSLSRNKYRYSDKGIRFLIDEKESIICSYWQDGKRIDFMAHPKMDKFEGFLFKLWAGRHKIVIDDEDCNVYLEGHGD